MDTMTTGQAAAALGTTEFRISNLMRRGKIKRPEKVNGRCRWTKKDVENARTALERNGT